MAQQTRMQRLFRLDGLLYEIAIVLSTTLGFLGKPLICSVLAGSVLGVIGYSAVRIPQLANIYRNNRAKVLRALLTLLIMYGVVAAILYGMGWGVSRLFA